MRTFPPRPKELTITADQTASGGIGSDQTYDTRRSKHYDLNPARQEYMVPAAPQPYSSAAAGGTCAPETSVLVDASNKRLTVPPRGTARLYRIGWTG